jgi:hypothetical protein
MYDGSHLHDLILFSYYPNLIIYQLTPTPQQLMELAFKVDAVYPNVNLCPAGAANMSYFAFITYLSRLVGDHPDLFNYSIALGGVN